MAAKNSEILELLLKVAGAEDVGKLRDALDKLGTEATENAGRTDKLTGELEKLTTTAATAADAIRLKAALKETTDSLAAAEKGLAELNEEFTDTGKRTGAVGQQFKLAEKAVADLTAQQREQELALKRSNGALQKAGVDTDKLADETGRLERELLDATKATTAQAVGLKASRDAAEKQAQAYDKLTGSLRNAGQRLNDIGGKFAAVGIAAAAAAVSLAVYGTTKFFEAGLEDAGAFESALGRIQAAAGLTADEMGGVKESIEETAAAASKDVSEAADAFEELTREGSSAAQAAQQLGTALDFATASAKTGKEAVAVLASVMDGFGLGAERTAEVADLVAAAALKGGTSVGDFAGALEAVGPTARTLGLDLQDTASALAVLAANGIEGSRAGAALRAILGDLADPTSKLSTELDKAGITTRDLGEVVEQLGQKGSLADGALNALGDRSGAALRVLASDGGAALRVLRTDLDDVTGAAGEMAAIINKDLDTARANLGRAFTDLRRELAEPLLGPLMDELDGLTASIREFADSPEFAQIRDALPELFRGAAEAAKQLIADIDFQEVAQRIADFSRDSKRNFEEFAAGLRSAKDAIVIFANGINVLVQSFQTFVNGAAAVVSGLLKISSELAVLQAKAALFAAEMYGNEQAIAATSAALAVAQSSAEAFGAAFDQNIADLKRNTGELGQAVAGLGAAMEQGGRSSQAGADAVAAAVDQTNASLAKVEGGTANVAAAWADLATAQEATAASAETTGQRTVDAVKPALAQLQELQTQAAAAQLALKAALMQGAPPEDIQQLMKEFERLNAEIARLQKLLNAAGVDFQDTSDNADRAGQGLERVSKGAQEAGEQLQQAGEAAEGAGAKSAGIIGLLIKLNEEFAKESPALREYFVNAQRYTVDWSLDLQDVEARIYRVADATRAALASQQAAFEGVAEQYGAFADGVDTASLSVQNMGEQGEASLRNLAEQVRQGRAGFDLLNQAKLDQLGAQLDRAADRVARITAEAQKAKAELESIADALQDAADRRAGNDQAIAARQYEEQLERINALAEVGGQAAREQAERARLLAEQEYLAQLAALQQQQQQQQAAATQVADHQIQEAQRAAAEIARTQQDLSGSSNFNASTAASSERTVRVEITVNNRQGPGDIINELSEQDIGRLAQRIMVEIAQNKGLSL